MDRLKRSWEQRGLGWQAEELDSQGGFATVALYYGSSVYDTKQMSALINRLVRDCKALGIETMPPDALAALLGQWNKEEPVCSI